MQMKHIASYMLDIYIIQLLDGEKNDNAHEWA